MKLCQTLLAVMLFGAIATDVAVARPRHPVQGAAQGSNAPVVEQKTGGKSDNGVVKKASGAANGDADDKGSNSGGPADNGPLKKGETLPGKGAPQNSAPVSSGDIGKSQSNGNNGVVGHGIDAMKSDNVIADGPGHKFSKPVSETTKKIAKTIPMHHWIKNNPRPSASRAIDSGGRNAIGVALHRDIGPQVGADAKIGVKVGSIGETGLPGSTATKQIGTISSPVGHPVNGPEAPPKNGEGISGTFSRHAGLGIASIGGPTKSMVGVLSGSSFRPRHP